MRVLVINCGSSSLKFDVMAEQTGDRPDGQGWTAVARGIVDRFGPGGQLRLEVGDEPRHIEPFEADGIEQAVSRAISLLRDENLLDGLAATGHRVVHGGARFRGPALIDDDVLGEIDGLSRLAPLHNQPALQAIRAVQGELRRLPAVAVFDTSFYADLPEYVALYALPRPLSQKHSIRRYGFHGLAHRSMIQRYHDLHPGAGGRRLITLQLGNGCSATASDAGLPVETSMGFTPLEGLIMGTRSGDLDPSIPLHLAEREGMTLSEVEALLNRRSGLYGLSGRSGDMRDLLQAADEGIAEARLAIDAFCHRLRKYVGAYLAVLGGADGLVFGGGIGQNSAAIRTQVCEGLGWAGIELDAGRNATSGISEARISTDASAVEAWVMDVDEAKVIAHDVSECLETWPPAGSAGSRR